MPTYDYQCQECDYKFEEFQQMSAALLTTCPKCKGPLKRLIGAGAGIIFKGSGFYYTDYVKKDAGANQTDSTKNASPTKSNSDAKSNSPASDTKPAAKKPDSE